MTLLSDRDILLAINNKEIGLEPFEKKNLQPSSVDVRLGADFKILWVQDKVDPRKPPRYDKRTRQQHLEVRPGMLVLASTMEKLTLPSNVAARLEGKSTLGRMGLLTHATAGFIDPGFSGQITLELSVVGSHTLVLTPGMLIGQLCFFRMSSTVSNPYGTPGLGSHYQNQAGPTAPAEAAEQLPLF
jgi:dCTP deaminase